MKAWPPPNSFLERGLEILVDLGESFFEFLARDLIDLFDRRRRVLDGGDQVFALGFEERVALGGFFVFLESHHVDRAHGFELGAHVAVELVFGGELFAGDRFRVRVRHQRKALDAEFVQAGFGHVLRVGLSLAAAADSSPRRSRA
jgi:hypothetical protein